MIGRGRSLARAVMLAGVTWAATAAAWPVDVRISVERESEVFRKLSAVDWVEAENPKIAEAEVLPSGELMITGVAPGKTLLLLYAEGRFAVWRIEVLEKGGRASAPKLDPTLVASAKKACPGIELRETDPRLVATVKSERCRQALLALVTTDALLASELELTFTLEALQAQLAAIDGALAREKLGLKSRYLGAGLVLEGALESAADRRRALWAVFRQALGRVPLEDRMRLPASAPDAGRE